MTGRQWATTTLCGRGRLMHDLYPGDGGFWMQVQPDTGHVHVLTVDGFIVARSDRPCVGGPWVPTFHPGMGKFVLQGPDGLMTWDTPGRDHVWVPGRTANLPSHN